MVSETSDRLIVGVTGGIGSGKSAATGFFEELGIEVVDADLISREVVEPGSEALAAIAGHFGPEILMTDGTLDRKALRTRIFNDPDEKRWLEELLHPRIRRLTEHRLKQGRSDYVLLSSPLLLETGQDAKVDRVLVIDVPESLQIRRTVQRDGTTADSVEAIMSAQIARPERLARADDVIVNDQDLDHLKEQVRLMDEKYRRLATGRDSLRQGPAKK